MPIEFKLPDPGEGIHEAEVLKVLVSEGDRVEEEQPIVEIETDKAAIEIPSPVTGTIKEVRVKEGDVIQVGDVIMVFLQEGERQKGEAAEEPKKARKEAVEAQRVPQEESRALKREQEARAEEKEEPEEKEQKKEEPERPREAKGPVPAAPATRRLARELGVDLKDVKPSGPGGRVTAEDIRAHAEKPKEKPQEKPKPEEKPARAPRLKEAPQLPDFTRWGPVERTPFRSIRRATAKRMALSWEQIPHVVHQDLADITELESFRREYRSEIEKSGGALTLTIFAVKAAVAALKKFPNFNSSLDLESGEIVLKKYYHIGVAVDTENGLIVPVIRNADCKSIMDLSKEFPGLAERTRKGEIELEEMSGGTFTITNVGPLGGTGFSPMINFPQVAILGLAKARLQPIIKGNMDHYEVVPRLMLPMCVAFDHRIVDGADAARFMGEIIALLESPKRLMMT